MTSAATLQQDNPRHLAAIIGGQIGPRGTRTAMHEYRLGCARDGEMLLVAILNGEKANLGIAFEARDFDQAFERALAISEDMAKRRDTFRTAFGIAGRIRHPWRDRHRRRLQQDRVRWTI